MSKRKPEAPMGEMGLSRNYFSQSMLPDLPNLRIQTIAGKQTYSQYDGIEFLFVTQGTGTLLINGKKMPLCRGSSFILFFYHFRRIEPTPGTELKVVSIRITYNSYLFLSTAPSWDLSFFEQTIYLPRAVFQDEVIARCETMIDGIRELLASNVFNREQQIQILLAELIARLYREAVSQDEDGGVN